VVAAHLRPVAVAAAATVLRGLRAGATGKAADGRAARGDRRGLGRARNRAGQRARHPRGSRASLRPARHLAAVTTRLAIDQLRSARARREQYVGEWLLEPLLTDESALEGQRYVEQADSLSMAFLLLLEWLSPVERAMFLLREVFDYGYGEIAKIVGKSEDNCRQLAVGARRHIQEGRA